MGTICGFENQAQVRMVTRTDGLVASCASSTASTSAPQSVIASAATSRTPTPARRHGLDLSTIADSHLYRPILSQYASSPERVCRTQARAVAIGVPSREQACNARLSPSSSCSSLSLRPPPSQPLDAHLQNVQQNLRQA